MKRIVVGVFGRVDAGKSSLIKAIFSINKQTIQLDDNEQEKKRGITIFSKTASLIYKDTYISIIDTPGHAGLSNERRRALKAIDSAILLIASDEEISLSSKLIFDELVENGIPIFIFANKIDRSIYSENELIIALNEKLSTRIVTKQKAYELVALSDESLLEQYLNDNILSDSSLNKAIHDRIIYPFLEGSAINNDIANLLDLIVQQAFYRDENKPLQAYIYKKADYGKEIVYFTRIYEGILNNKMTLNNGEKINEIRYYNGNKYINSQQAGAGEIVGLLGPDKLKEGMHLPSLKEDVIIYLPYLSYEVKSANPADTYQQLKRIENEFPELSVDFEAAENVLTINLNGQLMADIISALLKERYNNEIELSPAIIKYLETIDEETEGFAHYETNKYFAEIYIKLKPNNDLKLNMNSLKQSSDAKYLINFLKDNPPIGLYTNEPLTSLDITILNINCSSKHNLNDLEKALYHSINQALKKVKPVFLEPYITFSLTMPFSLKNKYYSLIEKENGLILEDSDLFKASLALKNLAKLLKEVNADEIIYTPLEINYKKADDKNLINKFLPIDDLKHPDYSIFVKNGELIKISGEDIEQYLNIDKKGLTDTKTIKKRNISDAEILKVWQNTYKEKPSYKESEVKKPIEKEHIDIKTNIKKADCYLIDGYNLLYAYDYKETDNLEIAREKLIDFLANAQAYLKARLIIVFDAYKTANRKALSSKRYDLDIIFTANNQTADAYIQEAATVLAAKYHLYVVSSDGLIQLSVFTNNVLRISSDSFLKKINKLENIDSQDKPHNNQPLKDLKDKWETD